MATTAKRGEKAKPASKPGRHLSKSLAQPTSTKKGPGRRHVEGHTHAVKRVKEPGGYGKGLLAMRTRDQLNALNAKRKPGAVIVAALQEAA